MSTVLVTGASGFLGQALIPKLIAQGHRVLALSRHPPKASVNLIPLEGDVTMPSLGLQRVDQRIDACYHLAAILRLGQDKDSTIYHTNVYGTQHVIDFCRQHDIPHLYFCSTAYTRGRNVYEISKKEAERLVMDSRIPTITIFKPSIVMGMPNGHFSLFVGVMVKVHRRAEIVRRNLEGALRLPVLEPVFRIKGNPEGHLNLVPVQAVATAMADIKGEGVYWLTNPSPPTIEQLTKWTGELIMVKLSAVPKFKPMPLESAFQRMTRAFQPYLEGDTFPSHITSESAEITKEMVKEAIRSIL